MRSINFVTRFGAFRESNTIFVVICQCSNTYDVEVVRVGTHYSLEVVPSDRALPDVRQMVPVTWGAVPAQVRASVEAWWHGRLVELYGEPTPVAGTYAGDVAITMLESAAGDTDGN